MILVPFLNVERVVGVPAPRPSRTLAPEPPERPVLYGAFPQEAKMPQDPPLPGQVFRGRLPTQRYVGPPRPTPRGFGELYAKRFGSLTGWSTVDATGGTAADIPIAPIPGMAAGNVQSALLELQLTKLESVTVQTVPVQQLDGDGTALNPLDAIVIDGGTF